MTIFFKTQFFATTATNPKRRQPKRRQPKRRQIQNGDIPKRRQTKTATSQNGDKPKRRHSKTAITKTATHPKRRHAKTATHPKRRQPRRRQPKRCMSVAVLACRRFGYNQNGDNPTYPKRRVDLYTIKTATLRVAVLDLSPFWRVAVLDTTKTATNPKRRQSNYIYFQKLSQFKTATDQNGACRRFDVSPF